MEELVRLGDGYNLKIHLERNFFKHKAKLSEEFLSRENYYLDMGARRTFHKMVDCFVESINFCFNSAPEICENYFTLCENVRSGEYGVENLEKERLSQDILDYVCGSEKLIQAIHQYITDTYTIMIEGEHQDNQLQFKDSYARALHRSVIMFRLTVPIMNEYLKFHNLRKDDYLYMEMMGRVFTLFNYNDENPEEPLNLGNKIQKFVEIAVANTLYSDKVIWTYLLNQSITEKTVAIDIQRNLLCNILPKMENNKSVVSFFIVVIRNSLQFQFTTNFKHTYRPVSIMSSSSGDVNPFMRLEQHLTKTRSELELLMHSIDLEEFIDTNFHALDYPEDLAEFYYHNAVIFSSQTKILNILANYFIGDGVSVSSLSREYYIKFAIIAQYWLDQNGFPFMAFSMLARPSSDRLISYNFKRVKSVIEVTESEIYKRVLKKYEHCGIDMNQKDLVLDFVAELINTDYEFYTLPDGSTYEPSEEVPSVKSAIVEVLRFIEEI